jgi:hypothetical protein
MAVKSAAKQSDKTYVVIEGGFEYFDDDIPKILHLTAAQIQDRYKGYELEYVTIIDGEVMKGYGATSLPRLQ